MSLLGFVSSMANIDCRNNWSQNDRSIPSFFFVNLPSSLSTISAARVTTERRYTRMMASRDFDFILGILVWSGQAYLATVHGARYLPTFRHFERTKLFDDLGVVLTQRPKARTVCLVCLSK